MIMLKECQCHSFIITDNNRFKSKIPTSHPLSVYKLEDRRLVFKRYVITFEKETHLCTLAFDMCLLRVLG